MGTSVSEILLGPLKIQQADRPRFEQRRADGENGEPVPLVKRRLRQGQRSERSSGRRHGGHIARCQHLRTLPGSDCTRPDAGPAGCRQVSHRSFSEKIGAAEPTGSASATPHCDAQRPPEYGGREGLSRPVSSRQLCVPETHHKSVTEPPASRCLISGRWAGRWPARPPRVGPASLGWATAVSRVRSPARASRRRRRCSARSERAWRIPHRRRPGWRGAPPGPARPGAGPPP